MELKEIETFIPVLKTETNVQLGFESKYFVDGQGEKAFVSNVVKNEAKKLMAMIDRLRQKSNIKNRCDFYRSRSQILPTSNRC